LAAPYKVVGAAPYKVVGTAPYKVVGTAPYKVVASGFSRKITVAAFLSFSAG